MAQRAHIDMTGLWVQIKSFSAKAAAPTGVGPPYDVIAAEFFTPGSNVGEVFVAGKETGTVET